MEWLRRQSTDRLRLSGQPWVYGGGTEQGCLWTTEVEVRGFEDSNSIPTTRTSLPLRIAMTFPQKILAKLSVLREWLAEALLPKEKRMEYRKKSGKLGPRAKASMARRKSR